MGFLAATILGRAGYRGRQCDGGEGDRLFGSSVKRLDTNGTRLRFGRQVCWLGKGGAVLS